MRYQENWLLKKNINAIKILQSALCETCVKTKFSKINNKISFNCEIISALETTSFNYCKLPGKKINHKQTRDCLIDITYK